MDTSIHFIKITFFFYMKKLQMYLTCCSNSSNVMQWCSIKCYKLSMIGKSVFITTRCILQSLNYNNYKSTGLIALIVVVLNEESTMCAPVLISVTRLTAVAAESTYTIPKTPFSFNLFTKRSWLQTSSKSTILDAKIRFFSLEHCILNQLKENEDVSLKLFWRHI